MTSELTAADHLATWLNRTKGTRVGGGTIEDRSEDEGITLERDHIIAVVADNEQMREQLAVYGEQESADAAAGSYALRAETAEAELAEAKQLLAATEACVHTKLAELGAAKRDLANVRQVIDCLAEFSPEPASADPVAYAQRKITARAYRFAADLLRAALTPAVAAPDAGTVQGGTESGQERENSGLEESA